MNKQNIRGSEWRKWDLHIHTPASFHWDGGKKMNLMTEEEKEEEMKLFIKAVNDCDVEVFCVMDYWTFDWYTELQKYIEEHPDSLHKTIFPGIELRIECPVDYRLNIHCILSNTLTTQELTDFKSELYIRSIEKKLSNESLKIFAKSLDESKAEKHGYVDPKSLGDEKLLQLGSITAEVTKESLQQAFKQIPAETGYVILPYDTSDGLLKLKWEDHPHDDNYFMQSAHIFETRDQRNIDLCSGIKTLENSKFFDNFFKTLGEKAKPCISGSDAHKYDNYGKFPSGKTTWIKANPSFEGLKQIIYEPDPGERVKISPVEPDQKDAYKVISKIRFSNTSDFPEEIKFNNNLCSIIGSRSSGKSALLAYVAHSVDAELTGKMIKGPGEGDEYHWDKIINSQLEYSIEWRNGQSNEESPGKIVYIPQDYLFEKSKDPDEIKEKIKPVLFKGLPDFKEKFIRAENNIEILNFKIDEQVDNWFDLSDDATSISEQLKDLGNKEAIKTEKDEIEKKINNLKEKTHLSEEELKQYQKASADISDLESKVEIITTDLRKLSDVSEANKYFSGIEITLSPALASLPKELQDIILKSLEKTEDGVLEEVNKQIVEYKKNITDEKIDAEEKKKQIREDNINVMEKYHGNVELEGLVNKINEYNNVLNKIEKVETEKKEIQKKSDTCVETIKSDLNKRKSIIEDLKINIQSADQSILGDIEFGVEFGVENNLNEITEKINTKAKTEFVDKGQLQFDDIRKKPGEFLSAVYSGQQKVIAGNDKRMVARDTLSLTEEILFTAKMEEDKIGGFSEPTMTAGKRALFALKLILAESDDTWPLLIDQPEDDLDSRSIYDDVVPFLKKKKKERQVIMVSHNANLVIGADSEQVIVANRHGTDRENSDAKKFNYLTGSLEFTKVRDKDCKDTLLSQGIREHSCEILDGGKTAFEKRKNKYNI